MDQETRTAILSLHRQGHGSRKIAQALGVSRTSVKLVVKNGIIEPVTSGRASVLDKYLEDIRELVAICKSKRRPTNLVRVKEELENRIRMRGEKLEVSYSALTWFCREHGIGVKEKVPAAHIITDFGVESQHDTSPYTLLLGGKKVKRHCASLVLGYSRMLFIRFFEKFDRFHMKIFLTDAFRFLDGVCVRCVIDNTSCAIIHGSGSRAQMSPEIEAFEKRFSFHFLAHEVGHCDRKGKIERPFDYVENNFLVGRTFKDDKDLDRQALEWLEKTANRRRIRELKASPLELFAAEKPKLIPLPIYIPEVYRIWQRCVDAHSCISLHAQKYPVPAAYIDKEVLVRETKDRVIVFDGHKEIAAYDKKIEGSPVTPPPSYAPRRQSSAYLPEEDKLKALGKSMAAYLQALKTDRGARYIWCIKKLFRLLCQYKAEDLQTAVAKAYEHHLFDINRVETILLQNIAARDYFLPLEFAPEDYEKWPQYQQGAVTPEPDIKTYVPEEKTDDPGNS